MQKNQQLVLYTVLSILIIAAAGILYQPDNELTGKQFYIYSQVQDKSFLANGELCNLDSECYSDYCFTRRCSRASTLLTGDPCSEDRQCGTGFCHRGKCTKTNTILREGYTCQDSRECISGACYENKCVQGQLNLRQGCVIDEQCYSTFCFKGRCEKAWNVLTGEGCIEDKQCQSGICSLGECVSHSGEGPITVRDLRGVFATGKLA